MHWAASKGHSSCVQLLLAKNVSVDVLDRSVLPPLHAVSFSIAFVVFAVLFTYKG
jgi:hypothetical protein